MRHLSFGAQFFSALLIHFRTSSVQNYPVITPCGFGANQFVLHITEDHYGVGDDSRPEARRKNTDPFQNPLRRVWLVGTFPV
jgi:hypothetical protein